MSISLHTNSLYTNYTSSSNLFDDPQNLQHDPNHKTESDVNVDKLSESASSDSNVVQENPVQTPRTSEQIFGIPDHDFYHHIIESIKLAEGAAATSSPTPQAQPQPVPTKKEILETHPNGTPKTERLTFEDGHQELLRYEGADNPAHPDHKNITQRVKVAADEGSHSVMNYDPQNESQLISLHPKSVTTSIRQPNPSLLLRHPTENWCIYSPRHLGMGQG
jgi:hypothetical protein